VLEKHGVTTNHVKTWAAFVTRCGFKCSFIAPAKDTNCVGILQFNREDYVNVTHFKIGLTAGRYLGYHYAQGFKDIPHMATFLYEKFPDLDAYQALILAHYGNPVGTYFDAGHGMIKFASGCPKLLTKEQFLKRMEKHDNYNVNSDCTEYTAKYKAGELLEKGKAGKWEELIELLSK
jgi:hypothetical protein